MLATIRDRLSDFHRENTQSNGDDRESFIERESAELCRVASRLGPLKKLNLVFCDLSFDAIGSEHAVSYNDQRSLIKTTIPEGGFGLIPKVTTYNLVASREAITGVKQQIEFMMASPLEYLDRWALCNELFNDTVDVEKVIQWKNEDVSIVVSQPYYMGEIVTPQIIEDEFVALGWEKISVEGRAIFYNFAYDAIALDLEPRNCYMGETGLQPFDLIVSHPDEELKRFLAL